MSVRAQGGVAGESAPLSQAGYSNLIEAIRRVVHEVVPPNATVLVASKGDEQLVSLGPRRALHFPQEPDGRYAGYHPADSEAAISMLEQLRASGAEYFLLPSSAFWWLDYYEGFRRHIESNYRVVADGEYCWIAALTEVDLMRADTDLVPAAVASHPGASSLQEVLRSLLPEGASTILVGFDSGQAAHAVSGAHTRPIDQLSATDPMRLADDVEASRAGFLVISPSMFEWMEDHPRFAERLNERFRFVTRQEHLCEIHERRSGPGDGIANGSRETVAPAPGEGAPAAQRRRSLGEWLRSLFGSGRS